MNLSRNMIMANWHWVVLGLLSALLAPYALHRLVADYWMGGYENDFRNYYEAAVRWLQGGDVYAAEQGFIYPPPAVLLFVPLTVFACHAAYVVFSALSLVLLGVAVVLTASVYKAAPMGRVPWFVVAIGLLFSLALAPTFENAAWGQVNTLVLLCALAFFRLLDRNHPWWAGFVLAVGTWLKIYPAILLWSVILGRRCLLPLPSMSAVASAKAEGEPTTQVSYVGPRRAGVRVLLPLPSGERAGVRVSSSRSLVVIISYILCLLLIPVLLLPLLPLDTYREFVTQVLPGASGIAKPRIMNQSVIGALARWSLGPVDTLLNTRIPLAAWMDWTNKGLFLASIAGLTAWCCWRNAQSRAGATSPAPLANSGSDGGGQRSARRTVGQALRRLPMGMRHAAGSAPAGSVVPAVQGAMSSAPEQQGISTSLVASTLLLACIPVFSPLGWCYVYVLVYPLIFLALITARGWLSKFLVVASVTALMVPVHHIIPGADHLPLLLQHLLYSRYLPATLVLALVVIAAHGEKLAKRQGPRRAA